MMKYCILTNNPQAVEKFSSTHDVVFVEGGLKDVFIAARDMIDAKGSILLNHPLYGSVKPNETPYRSLLLRLIEHNPKHGCAPADPESVRLIEYAINTANKFTVKKEIIDPRLLDDFQVVDLSLLTNAVETADR